MLWLVPAALLGHGFLCTAIFNRLGGLGIPQRYTKLKLLGAALVTAAVPLAFAWRVAAAGEAWSGGPAGAAWRTYGAACLISLAIALAFTLRRRLARPAGRALADSRIRGYDLTAELGFRPTGKPATAWLTAIPGNQALHPDLTRKTLVLPRLPPELEGLRIVHLSDTHVSGQFDRAYYRWIVEQANAADPDLIAVTGDIIEKRPWLAWAADPLADLRARHGVWFVLGNHDQRVRDEGLLRRTLAEAGWRDLGRRWETLDVRGATLLLAGNERPWFGPAADLAAAPPPEAAFRLLLSHSPDQLAWARRRQFDLMLAGHTHGGQFRLPLLGPLICPSLYGVWYAEGVFHEPPTVLHVSRGCGGVFPLRFGVPPEVAVLTLKGGGETLSDER